MPNNNTYESLLNASARDAQELAGRLQGLMNRENLKSGDKLPPERSLAESFGVSRNSIRKAIQILTDRGLLERRQGDGTYVLRLETGAGEKRSDRTFAEIIEARRILEPRIAELACERRTPAQLDQLKIITCDQQRRLLTGQDDGHLDARFHYCFALCSGNSLLAEAMEWLNKLYRYGRVPELRDHEWRQFSVNTHLRIIDALERRAVRECIAAIEDHLATVARKHPLAMGKTDLAQDSGEDKK